MGKQYQHAEAFCLMWYACDCGHRERIWNSRDGVTPFGLGCPSCGRPELRHTDFRRDERKPDHKLAEGQRFFRDGRPEEAVAIIKRRLQMFKNAGQEAPPEIAEMLLADAAATRGEWQSGWPAVDRFAALSNPRGDT